jgi:hypothetical protein
MPCNRLYFWECFRIAEGWCPGAESLGLSRALEMRDFCPNENLKYQHGYHRRISMDRAANLPWVDRR